MVMLCSIKKETEHKKGEVIINAGDPVVDFTYLKEGLVKLYKINEQGKEQIISFAKPMDFVSILSVFSEHEYQYSVMAIEDSVTCNISFEVIMLLINNNPGFASNMLSKMSRISDKLILENLEIRDKNLRGRVAYLLLYFSNHVYQRPDFELPVSRKEMGNFIGMSTENVIRALSDFRKSNIIKIFGKVIEIIDLEKLNQIARLG
jgi:CRP/FNR family transcriptional regulator